MNKTKFLILLTVFIDIIGVGVVIPILPFYIESFHGTPFIITALFATFALCSFLSAPIIGALSDKFGRRPMLIASITSTAIGWFIFALAPNILFLFIGRIIDGLAAGNFPIAQAYLSDISKDQKERAHNLGLIGAIFGIGFIIGPFLGGALGTISHSFPFWFVGGLAFVNAILAFFFLPETHTNRNTAKKIAINPFTPIKKAIQSIDLRANYGAWLLFGLGIASFQAILSLYMQQAFLFSAFQIGLVFATTGVIIALNQGFGLKHIWLKHFSEPRLELGALLVFGVGLCLLSIQVLWFVCAVLFFTTFCQGILRVVMTSQIVSKAPQEDRGEILGITSAISSLSMAIAPIITGALFEINSRYSFLFAGSMMLIAFFVLYQKRKQLKKIDLQEDIELISEI